jgi:DNA-binding NarL/FixJ family response regulator
MRPIMQSALPSQPPRLRTFVVEDSSVIRDNLRETLEENAPIQVVGSAEDEKAAVAWMKSHQSQCDLVIVDIFLKQGSGLGVLKGLAGLVDSPRRVVLSNHATPEIRAKCAELGAEKVFDKSNELEEMLRWFNRIGGVEAEVSYDA